MVADYFVQMRKTGKYVPPNDSIVHVQEMLTLMSALTNVESYEEVKGKEQVNMCTVLDEVEAKKEREDVKDLIDYGRSLGDTDENIRKRIRKKHSLDEATIDKLFKEVDEESK